MCFRINIRFRRLEISRSCSWNTSLSVSLSSRDPFLHPSRDSRVNQCVVLMLRRYSELSVGLDTVNGRDRV